MHGVRLTLGRAFHPPVSAHVGEETTTEEPVGFEATTRFTAKWFHCNSQVEIKGTSLPSFQKLTWNSYGLGYT